ncbi:hypothetical protein SAMN05660199_04053 [Klenkia soli]|uniref:Uncharacterized protein n=1 Tax=Klenkia soli TaxID=1052260 RepID=A0A1H0T6X9_9ACTN|nr:hypothetical protein [Klenkia soli]SDP49226.1 hypothetical protein SAMN05660199_04053 [Klenkia soli]
MIPAPGDAPARPDLGWLRHRTRRVPVAAAPAPVAPYAVAGQGGSGSTTGLADFLAGRTTRRQPAPAPSVQVPGSNRADGPPELHTREVPTPGAADPLDLGTSAADPLDLSAPIKQPVPQASPQPTPPPAGGDLDLGSSDLDLSGPPPVAAPPAPAPPASSSLDLFPEAPAAPPARTPVARPRPVARQVPRVPHGGRVILTPREPVVTLDRVQSGVGALTITAVCSPAVGDLVLGAVYQLADGSSGVVSRTAGVPTAPPRSRRPVLEAGRDEHDQIRVDLRQTRSLRRFVVHAMSASEGQLAWGGTLVITTHGGSRVEIPLDLAPHAGPVVLASVHAVDGEFVVRAELDPVHGLVRDVALAHGFRAITWADARTPVL